MKLICPLKGYLVTIKDIEIDKRTIISAFDKTGNRHDFYIARVWVGDKLFNGSFSGGDRRLEINENGGLNVLRKKYKSETWEPYGSIDFLDILINTDGTSKYILEFENDTDVELYLNLIDDDTRDGGNEFYEW